MTFVPKVTLATEGQTALHRALEMAGYEADTKNRQIPDDYSMYRFLSNTPVLVLIIVLEAKLKVLGYEIRRIKQ